MSAKQQKMKLAIAIGGASGSIYAKLLLDRLVEVSDQLQEVSIVMSKNAYINWELEIADTVIGDYPFKVFANTDFMAPFASGSAKYDAMIVCPCSMGLVGRIANGISNDLITRGADVMLKERKKLILIARETPFSLIHLRNMTTITEAGGIICPAVPSMYSNPETINALLTTVVDRALDLVGLELESYRWGE